jgi:hypothetical protein
MNHIFISHSHEDSDFAEILHSRLEQEGFSVWRDIGIHGGEDWRLEIDQAIKEAFTLIVVMTPEAKASEYVTYEWAFAWGTGVKVVPILLKRTLLHPRLESLQYLDFTNRKARPWDTLTEVLREAETPKSQEEVRQSTGIPDIEGEYHTHDSRQYRISITHISDGYYRVENPEWEGVGLFDGEFYYGVYKTNDDVLLERLRGNWGAHRAKFDSTTKRFELFGTELKVNKHYTDFEGAWIKGPKRR